jgi:deoxyadenosine/deoxycytidine kinase
VIMDRGIYEDIIFAKMLRDSGKMIEYDFDTYCGIFSSMCNYLHRLDLIIYLDVTPEIALDRVRLRGRECEKGIDLAYLTALRTGYEDWMSSEICEKIPVLRLDWNTFKSMDEVVPILTEFVKSRKMNKGILRF